MTRQLRPASPLHLYSPLYDPTLNILTTVLSLSFILLPIANTQMIPTNLTNKHKNISNEINLNYTKVEEYTISPNKNDENELINTVSSKNYQTLIDRFRRKDNYTKEKTVLGNNTVAIEDDYQIDLELEDDNDKDGLDNNSMEKLRVDDVTRTKIFNDFSKTVKIYKNQSKIDVDSETNETHDSAEIKGKIDREDIKRISNESLGCATRAPTSYHVPSITDVHHTPRPSFLDGLLKVLAQTTLKRLCSNTAATQYCPKLRRLLAVHAATASRHPAVHAAIASRRPVVHPPTGNTKHSERNRVCLVDNDRLSGRRRARRMLAMSARTPRRPLVNNVRPARRQLPSSLTAVSSLSANL